MVARTSPESSRVEHRGRLPAPVEGIHLVVNALVEDRVRVLTGLDRADRLQRLQVHDADRGVPAVADEAASQVGRQRDAVDASGRRDLAHDGVRVDVDDDDLAGMGDVEAARAASTRDSPTRPRRRSRSRSASDTRERQARCPPCSASTSPTATTATATATSLILMRRLPRHDDPTARCLARRPASARRAWSGSARRRWGGWARRAAARRRASRRS